MMFGYPFANYRNYPNYYNPYINSYSYNKPIYKNAPQNANLLKDKSKNTSSKKVLEDQKRATKSDISPSDSEAFFEILGIKLYFDDILLICLIFFLYQEGVQDQYLFIALILLLLS